MRILVVGAAAVAVTVGGLAPGARASTRCDTASSADVLCRTAGGVGIAPPWATDTFAPASNEGTTLRYKSRVRVDAGSSADATFAREAKCQLGSASPTELWTRLGAADVRTDARSLFWHRTGGMFCSFFGRARRADPYFCDGPKCLTFVYSNGVTQRRSQVHPPVARPRAAQQGLPQQTTQEIELEFCAGNFAIETFSSNGDRQYIERRLDDSLETPAHYRVSLIRTTSGDPGTHGAGTTSTSGSSSGGGTSTSVVETSTTSQSNISNVTIENGNVTTSTSTTSSSSSSVQLRVSSVAQAGVCAGPVFRSQRRWGARGR